MVHAATPRHSMQRGSRRVMQPSKRFAAVARGPETATNAKYIVNRSEPYPPRHAVPEGRVPALGPLTQALRSVAALATLNNALLARETQAAARPDSCHRTKRSIIAATQ